MATAQTAAQTTDRGPGPVAARLIVLGGGEHARVVADAARSVPGRWIVEGYAAPDGDDGILDVPWLGDDTVLAARLAESPPGDTPWLVLGFGGGASAADLASRVAVADRFGDTARWAALIHASAWVAPSAWIGPGAVVLAHAVVNAGARVGRHAIVNTAAVVEHDVVVGDGSHIAPAAAIGGGARIGAGVFVGLGARIRDHVEVGDRATVAMGAVVVGAVSPDEVVAGVPAHRLEPSR